MPTFTPEQTRGSGYAPPAIPATSGGKLTTWSLTGSVDSTGNYLLGYVVVQTNSTANQNIPSGSGINLNEGTFSNFSGNCIEDNLVKGQKEFGISFRGPSGEFKYRLPDSQGLAAGSWYIKTTGDITINVTV